MNPQNIACLTAAGIDCCVLANNHMLDWGIAGLLDTLEALDKAGIKHTGAGCNLRRARSPAILETGEDRRVIVFSLGSLSSGIPAEWSAREDRPGLSVIERQATDTVRSLANEIGDIKREGDVVIVSIHWGGNWGYKIPSSQKMLAHRLVEETGLDILHGHSSHHVKAIEVYKNRLILYGCGDFFNDYEGIGGYEDYRGDLGLMYFADVDPRTGWLLALQMIPTHVRRFRVNLASEVDSKWLEDLLNREGKRFGTWVTRSAENVLTLRWTSGSVGDRRDKPGRASSRRDAENWNCLIRWLGAHLWKIRTSNSRPTNGTTITDARSSGLVPLLTTSASTVEFQLRP